MFRFSRNVFISGLKKIITCLILLTSQSGMSQSVFPTKLTAALNQFESTEQKEKIYLHTDKSFYLAGEICWFKAYVVDASLHKPFSLSKVAYVELLNYNSKPVLQGKISLQKGFDNGSFFLPLYLPSGSYKIRAYTNWMKNFGPEYFFEKNITVVNTLKRERDSIIHTTPGVDIQFFPEGGNLVDGISSVVGFKAVDERGKGISIEGDIVDRDKKTVAHFQSQLFGMGRFRMTAYSGNQYKAYVRTGENQLNVIDLPASIPAGYCLQVTNDLNNQLNITAYSSDKEDNRTIYLLIHTRGIVKYTKELTLTGGKTSVTIEKSLLGEGISSITLFNANQEPVCERLVFRMPSNLDISAQSEMDEYAVRKKISAFIHINNKQTDSAEASLSLSVYRTDSLQYEEGPDIRSYFYLGSDIKGSIEHPEYYFSHTGEQVDMAMDNLMLTQGWRRFKWADVLQLKKPEFEYIPEWAGHIVNGRITDRLSGQPLVNESVFLAGPAIKSQLAGCVSNKKGQLIYDFPHLMGSNVLIMQPEYRTDSNYRLEILNPFSEQYSGRRFPVFKLNSGQKDDLIFYNVGTQVENVFFLDKLMKFNLPRYKDSTSFYGEPDKKFFLDDYTRFNTMEEVVREYVNGLAVRKRQGKFYLRLLDDKLNIFYDQDPLIVLDGVPIFDASEIMALDPLKINKIEVVNRRYFLGSLVASGIFALYSYNNDMAGLQLNSHALVLEYDGLQQPREFYSPKYDQATTASKRLPDFRNVLTWQPNIVIGKSGEAKVDFYSSDRKGKYIGIVEGIDQNGVTGSTKFYFEVQ
jgi:hypothetical protein